MEYQIGDFSKISRLSIKTLRYYHEYGLLNPSRIDDISGYRYYNETALEKVNIILLLKSFDFSLKEIKDIIDNYTSDFEIISFLKDKKSEINSKIYMFKKIEKKLNLYINRAEEDSKMKKYNTDIIIKDIPDMLVATVRFKGRYDETGKALGKVGKYYMKYINGKPFRLDHDGEYKEENADMEIGFPVKKDLNINEIASGILKGGKALTLIHNGSYESIGRSYKKIVDFINNNKINVLNPAREVYIKGPGMIFKGNPDNYITELQFMINN